MSNNATKLQAWWWHRQGLDGSRSDESFSEILAATGWARSVAGIGPYLTAWSRAAITRQAVDSELAAEAIQELPAARACTYIVPATDYAIALRVGEAMGDAEMKVACKLGVSEEEIQRLCEGVLKALQKGPMEPSEIREATGALSRSLGEEGKKKGVTTTLPVALGILQRMGRVRRIPVDGRLDQQRYRYSIWNPNPLETTSISQDDAYIALAERYFRWVGPATVSEFQWFSGLGVKATKSVLSALDLQPCMDDSDRMLLREDLATFQAYQPPKKPHYALISSLDTLLAARRNIRMLLSDSDESIEVPGGKTSLKVGQISDLPCHAIVDRGRLIGLWEYDSEQEEIVVGLFCKSTSALQDCIDRTCDYVRNQLGDARSFSLDSPKSRLPRIQFLRAMQKHP